jgi:ornithine cyclodeaminase/alanine dehydrogenase-like protein (mu-crystallin family)
VAAGAPMTVHVLGPEAIEAAVEPRSVLQSVRAALISHAAGRTTVPPPIHLAFPEAGGDCHVKAGMLEGGDDFTVKIASGFYGNERRGLPTNQGLVCVLDARTGRVRAVLDDGGRLTAWRTAAAGALVGDVMSRPDAEVVGVFGTGEQARSQVAWLAMLRPVRRVLVCGRDEGKAAALSSWFGGQGISARPASARETAAADIVITATPATAPVLDADDVRPGAHVTGIGADMPHKNELPPELFRRAATIATDDHQQCLRHGDFGRAVRAGAAGEHSDTAAGALLSGPVRRRAGAVTVADLTGVGALDAALASTLTEALLG